MTTDLTTTNCPSCGLGRTIHIDSLPAIERNDFLCSDCHSDRDRHDNGWTPANSLS